MLAQAVGGSAVFCFHDENLLLPPPEQSLKRIVGIRRALDEQGVTRAALVGKCRPDTVTPDLARALARLGVIRMYVGIENTSPAGAAHLNRGTDVATMSIALDAFAEAGIFVCYNLLVFEPQTTLGDVACNVAFMRAHASTPVNFCRAEPYLGTPMHRQLSTAGKLYGGFLGCDYRVADDRAELLLRITSSAFREHNFATEGVANRTMSLGYSAKLLEFFYQDVGGKVALLMERAQDLTRSITLDAADLFEQALDIAAAADLADHDRITRQTALLGLRVAASNRVWHAALDAIERDMARFARGEVQKSVLRSVGSVARVAQSAAVAGWLALGIAGSSGCATPVDNLPCDTCGRDAGTNDSSASDDLPIVADALPPDSGARNDTLVVADALPADASAMDTRADEGTAIDTSGIDGGVSDAAADAPRIVDALLSQSDAVSEVRDTGGLEPPFIVDPVVEAKEGWGVPQGGRDKADGTPRDYWALTSPTRIKRSQDLPLCLCPELRLNGEWKGRQVRAHLGGVLGDFATRWRAQGEIEGDGAEVLWTPSSEEDQLDVAVRTPHGAAVTLLRLESVVGRRTV